MARMSRRTLGLALLTLAAAPHAHAQLSNLPDLSTATETTATSASTAETTTDATTTPATTDASTTASFISSSGTATTTGSAFHLTGLPTIEGAGIPTLVIPYTADAPFMQKSNLPEGTVFIAVGGCLALLGICVLLWRLLIAWSINRSVKKAALASIRGGSEKNSTWGGSTGYNPAKGSLYKDVGGSSLSLDALTSSGKPVGKAHFRDHEIKRESTPPAGLFFSPTAQHNSNRNSSPARNSAYLPAGYYASPSAQAAGGAPATTIGGSLAPYARHSTIAPSPPSSPGLPPTSRGSATYRAPSREPNSRDGLRPSRDGYGPSSARNSYLDGTPRPGHASGLYAQPSSSSLMVGLGGSGREDGLPGSRAPSAYLDDLFENHGNGPRERF